MSSQKKPRVYIGLLHYPIYNKNMEIISTSITNLDIHDIARTARTYEVSRYFIIHPLETQRRLIADILSYWQEGYGSQYNPDRREAFCRVRLVAELSGAVKDIREATGTSPYVITTDARVYPNTISYSEMRNKLATGHPCLLLFGTGFGIAGETMMATDYILEPIYGPGDYNHLSVRSAAAIILDRLLGEPWWV